MSAAATPAQSDVSRRVYVLQCDLRSTGRAANIHVTPTLYGPVHSFQSSESALPPRAQCSTLGCQNTATTQCPSPTSPPSTTTSPPNPPHTTHHRALKKNHPQRHPRRRRSNLLQNPTYKLHGRAVLHFAAWKQHYSRYAATKRVVTAFQGRACSLRDTQRNNPLPAVPTRPGEVDRAHREIPREGSRQPREGHKIGKRLAKLIKRTKRDSRTDGSSGYPAIASARPAKTPASS